MSWVDAGADDLKVGGLREAVAGSVSLALARLAGGYVAFDAWCTHAQCPLADGRLEGDAVRCACHAALFELPSGDVLDGPATVPLRTYPARRAGGRVEVEVVLPGLG